MFCCWAGDFDCWKHWSTASDDWDIWLVSDSYWRNYSRAVWGSDLSNVWLSKLFGHLMCDICLKDYQFSFWRVGESTFFMLHTFWIYIHSLWHSFCVQGLCVCVACAGKVSRLWYMNDEFHLPHTVNSEPVLHGVSNWGGRLCLMQDNCLLFMIMFKECTIRVM